MLRELFENVAPYISNLWEIKKFVEENEDKSTEEIIEEIERRIDGSEGTLKTDYRILLNELEKTINNRM